MCLTCGCLDAHEVKGDNITFQDLDRIATSNGKSVDETLDTIRKTAVVDRSAHQTEYEIVAPTR